MVIETKPKPPLDSLTERELLEAYEDALAKMEGYKEIVDRIQMAIYRRMNDNNSTALLVGNADGEQMFTCERHDTYEYDHSGFTPLLEELTQTELRKCRTEGHMSEPTWIPPKWNTQQVKSIVTKRGGKSLATFNRARTPKSTKLVFERLL